MYRYTRFHCSYTLVILTNMEDIWWAMKVCTYTMASDRWYHRITLGGSKITERLQKIMYFIRLCIFCRVYPYSIFVKFLCTFLTVFVGTLFIQRHLKALQVLTFTLHKFSLTKKSMMISAQGPHHTKEVKKMVPVVPLFSTQHSKGKILALSQELR